ncbi:GNAT family N-acetyltransferase [Nocardioides alcanivorans]|uniref:GNAT family N-acetyltransferase n=1 Tax=Nocardioides alcanivorans TaxID=2897352 RepID=UPI001F47E9DF|nr:GNAT family N-acetyltransferase [Nocardioides alcanivorans]
MVDVRRLSPDDWPRWRDLRLTALADSPDAFGSTLERERAFTEADWRQRLANPTLVVEHGGQPIGCAAVFEPEPGLATVVAMWVERDHRGHGHSRVLLDHLVVWARERDDRIVLGVNRANPIARAAYVAYGFVPTGEAHPLRDGSAQLCDVLELPQQRMPQVSWRG